MDLQCYTEFTAMNGRQTTNISRSSKHDCETVPMVAETQSSTMKIEIRKVVKQTEAEKFKSYLNTGFNPVPKQLRFNLVALDHLSSDTQRKTRSHENEIPL